MPGKIPRSSAVYLLSYKVDGASKLRLHIHIAMQNVNGDQDLVLFILGCTSSALHHFTTSSSLGPNLILAQHAYSLLTIESRARQDPREHHPCQCPSASSIAAKRRHTPSSGASFHRYFPRISFLPKSPANVQYTDVNKGYNYPSLASILPHLEPTASGPSTDWAKATASRLNCIVTVGYPELCTSPPSATNTEDFSPDGKVIAYNSTISVSPTGEILAHYRKTHLYYTDETWAQESPSGWLSTSLTLAPKTCPEQIVQANFGICMDLNPHKFEAPWEEYEFASHALRSGSELLVLSMAWLTDLDASELAAHAEEPDLHTLSYWIERLKPLVEAESEVIAAFGNRCGEEGVRYAGSSWVGKVGNGVVKICEIMGRAQEGVIVADTEKEPKWILRLQAQALDEELVE